MTNIHQIVALFEEEHLKPDEIAQCMSMEEEAVKIALASNSREYNKLAKKNDAFFSNTDMENARMVMSGLLFSEHPILQYRAAKFVINENKGRHDVQQIRGLNINVNILNEQMKKAKEALKSGREKVIDIPSEVKHLSE